jgi:arylsulfatase
MLALFFTIYACGQPEPETVDNQDPVQLSAESPAPNSGPPVGGGSATAPPSPMGSGPLPPNHPDALPPVSAQSGGIYKKDAPSKSKDATSGALCPDCDIVLITVCSLRKDHVSLYGSADDLTPAIDALSEGGFHFDRAYSASNFTLAGLTAILTGYFGSSTGVTGWDKGLTKNVPTLPEVLGIYGYNTAAFTIDSASGFRPDYGLDRGFQYMNIFMAPPGTPDGRHINGEYRAGAAGFPVAEWLKTQDKERPLFAMFHSRTAHFPFVIDETHNDSDETGISRLLWESGGNAVSPKDLTAMPGMKGGTINNGVTPGEPDPLQAKVNELGSAAVDAWKARYKEAVNRMDEDVRVVMEAIEARGRKDKTIVLLVADHGESLNDHGELLHGDGFFDGVVNVPLVLRIPTLDGSNAPIQGMVSHVDIMPTLLDLIGATLPANIDGVSMVPLVTGKANTIRKVALSEGGVAQHDSSNPPGAVFSPPWSLLSQRRGCGDGHIGHPADQGMPVCLYSMDDSSQASNMASKNPEVVSELVGRWKAFRKSRDLGEAVQLDLSPEYIEELKRNGYDFNKGAP